MMNNATRSIKVFLCYASSDKTQVESLYSRLIKDGIDVWLDKEKLLPGQDWHIEIPKAVRGSDVVMVCLSMQSINKEGFVQREIKIALDAAEEKPEGTIFIIPARLEDCKIPDRLSRIHWVDLFSDNGYERLLKALQLRASTKKDGDLINSLVNKIKELEKTKEDLEKPKSVISFVVDVGFYYAVIFSIMFFVYDYYNSSWNSGNVIFTFFATYILVLLSVNIVNKNKKQETLSRISQEIQELKSQLYSIN